MEIHLSSQHKIPSYDDNFILCYGSGSVCHSVMTNSLQPYEL